MTETQRTPANLYADAVQTHVGIVHKIDGLRTAVGLIIAELDGNYANKLEVFRTARLEAAQVIVDGLEEGTEYTPLQKAAMADVESGEAVVEKDKEEANQGTTVEDKEEVAPAPQVDAGEEEDTEEATPVEEDSEEKEEEVVEDTKEEATLSV